MSISVVFPAVKMSFFTLLTNPTIKGNSDDLIVMIGQTKAYWLSVKLELESF